MEFWLAIYQDEVIQHNYFIIVAKDTIGIQEVGSPEQGQVMAANFKGRKADSYFQQITAKNISGSVDVEKAINMKLILTQK
jgi:hypothetical protein